MNARFSLVRILLVALFGVVAVACVNEEPPPVDLGEQQAGEPTPTLSNSAYAPGVSRDGPEGTFQYTVVAGDTVFSLANRYGTTVAVITLLNNLDANATIKVGQILLIPTAPPTATPTSTTATATPTRTPTQPAGGPSTAIYNGSRASNKVALTFDMGGRVEPALDIMNYLIANEIHATIFMTGAMVDNQNTNAGRQVLALVQAHPELFDFGNHSYSHPRFTELTDAQIIAEVQDTEDSIVEHSTIDPKPYFRPPEGAINAHVLDVIGDLGYPHTIMWDIDTIDWMPEPDGPTAAFMVDKVVTKAQGGSIVLMHLGGFNTFQALPGMIAGLEAKGFELAKISELMAE